MEYIEILNQKDMDALLDSVAGFHDSMTKEIHIINRGYVNPDHSMIMCHQFDGRLLIQSQWESFAIELLFCNIISFNTNDPGEYWSANGKVLKINILFEKTEIQMEFDSLSVHAERMFYCERGDWLGAKARFIGEVPSPNAVVAIKLDDDWRQCTNCFDAWEESLRFNFSLCPNCRKLTKIN